MMKNADRFEMNLIEAAKQALEALQSAVDHRKRFEVCANLRAAIEEAEKAKPVAEVTHGGCATIWFRECGEGTKLYTHPATVVPDVDWLSNVIREADGNNSLGAGSLAEKIVEAMTNAAPKFGEKE